jgi:hypothetical protein
MVVATAIGIAVGGMVGWHWYLVRPSFEQRSAFFIFLFFYFVLATISNPAVLATFLLTTH